MSKTYDLSQVSLDELQARLTFNKNLMLLTGQAEPFTEVNDILLAEINKRLNAAP